MVSNSVNTVYTVPIIPFSEDLDNPHPSAQLQKKHLADIQNIIDSILKCPFAKKLLDRTCQERDPLTSKLGPITVIYSPDACLITARTIEHGFIDHDTRRIFLGTLDPIRSLDILIFNIATASQIVRYRTIQKQAEDKIIDANVYAKEVERIAHQSGQLHHKIVTWGIKNLKWPVSIDKFKDIAKTDFEKRWKEIELTNHAEFYRKQFALITENKQENSKSVKRERPAISESSVRFEHRAPRRKKLST